MLSMITAMARNGIIGRAGQLPWNLPVDMAHFMHTTAGRTVIMGRRTFESMGRPLPGRDNVVLTRRTGFVAPGCRVARSVKEALDGAAGHDEVFVIGGSTVYDAFLPLTETLYLTRVHADVEGDVYFPEVDFSAWREVARRNVPADEEHAYAFSIIRLRRS